MLHVDAVVLNDGVLGAFLYLDAFVPLHSRAFKCIDAQRQTDTEAGKHKRQDRKGKAGDHMCRTPTNALDEDCGSLDILLRFSMKATEDPLIN